jgi:two-component system chemotaxis response regulator CheY
MDAARLRILVVDDQESMRQLLCMSLRNLGVQKIHQAEDGVGALAQLRARPIDLVLLDAEMPRMTGVETLTAMRADNALRTIPVIMVTGRADVEFVQSAARLGIDGYLIKPVSASALGVRIEAIAKKLN